MTHRRRRTILVTHDVPARTRHARWLRAGSLRAILRACIVVQLLFCCSIAANAQLHGSRDSTLRAIGALYEKGAYLSSEVEARRFLEQHELADSLRIAAEQYLAFALVAQGKTTTAILHFTAILDIDSTFELDPVYTSPKILASFDEARQLRRSRVLAADRLSVRAGKVPTAAVSWRVLVFPGWEQLHQGRSAIGYSFLGAGTLALGLSIGLEIERSSARSAYLGAATPADAVTRYDRYNRANKAETYSIIAFAAIYLSSEIDAFLNIPQSGTITLEPVASGLRLAVRF